jgi:hypothetical protein
MAETTSHTGGCHCGAVRYEVEGDFSQALSCNCSICQKTGTLLAFVPAAQFRLLAGDAALTDYQFNRKLIHHLFCRTCGIRSFAHANAPDGSPMVAVNVRCLDDVDLDAVAINRYDGRHA